MSRSFRKICVTGRTLASSEKDDKRRANRKLRRKVRDGNYDVTLREVSDRWNFAKDGKQLWHNWIEGLRK